MKMKFYKIKTKYSNKEKLQKNLKKLIRREYIKVEFFIRINKMSKVN